MLIVVCLQDEEKSRVGGPGPHSALRKLRTVEHGDTTRRISTVDMDGGVAAAYLVRPETRI